MEKNVAVIDIDVYNILRDLEKNIHNGKRLVVSDTHSNVMYQYFTDSEVHHQLNGQITDLRALVEQLKKKTALYEENSNIAEKQLRDARSTQVRMESNLTEKTGEIKKLSIFGFLKLKYSSK